MVSRKNEKEKSIKRILASIKINKSDIYMIKKLNNQTHEGAVRNSSLEYCEYPENDDPELHH